MTDPTPVSDLTGQHRVTTGPIEVEDWKGTYTLNAGEGFTVEELDTHDPAYINIERDGLLSGSMGGLVAVADVLAHTKRA